MDTMERDPQYIAETLRFLRKMFGLTQENLADTANLTTRTIEKVESGRHRPDAQTLRCIARALGLDVRVFEKPTPEQEAAEKAAIEHAIRKKVMVRTRPIRTLSDFLNAFDQRHAFRIDTSGVTDGEAIETAAVMADWITDMTDVWEDCNRSQRVEYARSFVELCQDLERRGYLCHMGDHRQRQRTKGKPDLVFTVGLMAILPKAEADGDRFIIVELEGGWETLEEDRPKL